MHAVLLCSSHENFASLPGTVAGVSIDRGSAVDGGSTAVTGNGHGELNFDTRTRRHKDWPHLAAADGDKVRHYERSVDLASAAFVGVTGVGK